MPVKTFRPLTPSTRYIAYRGLQRHYEDQAGEEPGRDPQEDRRAQLLRPRDGPRHRRRSQAEDPPGGFQAEQARGRSHGVGHRIRSGPHGPAGVAGVQGRREDLHHRPERAAGRREADERSDGSGRSWATACRCRSIPVGLPIHNIETDSRPRRRRWCAPPAARPP